MPTPSTTKQAAYSKAHYKRHREKIKASNARVRRNARIRNQEYVRGIKATSPCLDCAGIFHPAAMEFHHVGKKTANVAQMVNEGLSIARIDAEISQCELICSNCHRVRHALERDL